VTEAMHIIGQLVLLVLIVAFLWWMIRGPAPKSSEQATGESDTFRRRKNVPHIEQSPVALKATRQARYPGGPEYVNVTDLGLLVYQDRDQLRLVRQGPVPADAGYLRPFAELWLPYRARGTVRFEIRDKKGRLRYADEARYDLEHGYNTLLPGTWLPLRDEQVALETWEYRLLAGEMTLAVHRFVWQPAGKALRPYLANDGEISPKLEAALRAQAAQPVSLSELLASQEE
jgi:hypothetical protein